MPKALFHIDQLLTDLQAGATVLTPNNRLRNQMRLAYSQATASKVQPSPPIYSLEEWIQLQWSTLIYQAHPSAQHLIYSDIQLELLCVDILKQSSLGSPGANYQILAGQLLQAYRYLLLWEIPLNELINDARWQTIDSQTLHQWLTELDNALNKAQAITREHRHSILRDAFQLGQLDQIDALCLQGFDDLAPVTQQLVDNATVRKIPAIPKAITQAHCTKIGCKNLGTEARYAALWSQQKLRQNPEATIGIVVPELGQVRDQIERAFVEVFEPQFFDPTEKRYALPFNISAGFPLASAPVISDALLLLKIGLTYLDTNDWLAILDSPFFGDIDEELLLRSRLRAFIRRQQSFNVRGARIREYVHHLAEENTPQAPDIHSANEFSKRLQQAADYHRQHSDKCDGNTWITRIQSLLELLGWPGTRRLDSIEYQQVSQWYQLLEKLGTLDQSGKNYSHADISSILQRMAMQTHFQAEVKESPIYILGSLEGAGLAFDHCWILGMDNQSWPTKPVPNPLLPIALQRHYQLPRASVEREVQYAQSVTEKLLCSAPEIVVSFSEQRDEVATPASTLIDHLPNGSIDDILESTTSLFEQHHESLCELEDSVYEWVDCQHGPQFTPIPGQPVRGGSDILKQQALCPFISFAKHRLGARPYDKLTLGLNALEKGNVTHKVLELFWLTTKNQENLLQLENEAIEELVRQCVDEAMDFSYQRNIVELGDFYYGIEKQRITSLVLRWLDIEKERQPFSIKSLEDSFTTEFGGLTFKLRIDRIDQLNDELLLIDYKTGRKNESALYSSRIKEPQLPLYLASYDGNIRGISFANIHTVDLGFTGVAEFSSSPGINSLRSPSKAFKDLTWQNQVIETWEQVEGHYKEQLQLLADEFKQGLCAVIYATKAPDISNEDYTPLTRHNEQEFVAFSNDHLANRD
ncbi:PD-(D/E)XK nuclease family protein [Aurantivibrio plasticivorans]